MAHRIKGALGKQALWCPDYRSIRGKPWDCAVPEGWANGHWYFRQFSSTGSVDGISGNVDMNLYDGGGLSINAFALKSAVRSPLVWIPGFLAVLTVLVLIFSLR